MGTYELVVTPVHARFELGDCVCIARDAKDALCRQAAERQDAITQERQDHGNLELGIRSGLQRHDTRERLAVHRWVEGGVRRMLDFADSEHFALPAPIAGDVQLG